MPPQRIVIVNTTKTKKPNVVTNKPGIAMRYTRRNKREPINNNRRNRRPPYIITGRTHFISRGEPTTYLKNNPPAKLARGWRRSTMPPNIRAKLAPRQPSVRNRVPLRNLSLEYLLPLEYFMK